VLGHFNWELFDYLLIALISLRATTYLKNWVGSQLFNNSEELMEGVKTCGGVDV
jgi:hypothetical protein